MSFNILEKFTEGKRNDPDRNEDGFIVTDRYIGVADGASSAVTFNGVPGGLIAKNILINGIEKLEDYDDGFEAVKYLNSLLYEAQKNNPEAQTDPANRIMASLLLYNIRKKQIWCYGDCQYRVNGTKYRFNKKIDSLNADIRSFVNHAELAQGRTEEELLRADKGAEAVSALIKMQPVFANTDTEYGYPILDGFSLNRNLFNSYEVSEGDTVMMATDGYPEILPTLAESEAFLVKIKKEDRLLIKEYRTVKGFYPGLKSYDDRTYIRFTV